MISTGHVCKMNVPVANPHVLPLGNKEGASGRQVNSTWEWAGFLLLFSQWHLTIPTKPLNQTQETGEEISHGRWQGPQDCPSTHFHLLPFYDTEIGLWQMALNGTARKTSDRRRLPLSSNLLALSRRETPRPRATDLWLFKALRSHLKPMLRWKKKSKLRQCSKKQLKDH